MNRILLSVSVVALAGALVLVLIGHLWARYDEQAIASGFSGAYERYLASQAGFPDDPTAYREAAEAERAPERGRETAALEE